MDAQPWLLHLPSPFRLHAGLYDVCHRQRLVLQPHPSTAVPRRAYARQPGHHPGVPPVIKYFSLYSVYVQCKSFAKLTLYYYYSPSQTPRHTDQHEGLRHVAQTDREHLQRQVGRGGRGDHGRKYQVFKLCRARVNRLFRCVNRLFRGIKLLCRARSVRS